MDDRKIAALLETVEQGSFSKAAEKLGYTQSGLNRMINALEKEVGFPLLNRGAQGVSFNENGQELEQYFHMFIDSAHHLYRAAEHAKNVTSHLIRIGSSPSISALLLTTAISSWQKLHPDIKLHHAIIPFDTYTHVLDGELDFAIVDNHYSGPCEQQHLMMDEMYAVLPADSPYFEQDSITLEQLAENQIIISEYHPVTPSLQKLSAKQEILITSSDALSLMAMVKRGLGVTVLTSMSEPYCIEGVKMLPLRPAFYRNIVIIAKSFQELDSNCISFIDYLKENISIIADHEIEGK